MNDENYGNNVWPINASLENARKNQPFVELAGRYKDFKNKYTRASAEYQTAHLTSLELELDNTSTQEQLEDATRREQHYFNLMTRLGQAMQSILTDLGVRDEDLEARYRSLTTNISFANNPRYRNLRAALLDLYPGVNASDDDLEALIRGNVYVPNNTSENTPNTRAKKSRARNTLAAIRGGRRRRSSRNRRRNRTKKSRK
jgi:hypothetical protein